MNDNMIARVKSRGVIIGGIERELGEEIRISEFRDRDWLAIERFGKVDLLPDKEEDATVAPAVGEGSSGSSESGSPYLGRTRAQLLQLLQDVGLEESDVEGTGANGYVTKDDIVAALESLED